MCGESRGTSCSGDADSKEAVLDEAAAASDEDNSEPELVQSCLRRRCSCERSFSIIFSTSSDGLALDDEAATSGTSQLELMALENISAANNECID
jgi:hypothetical protein